MDEGQLILYFVLTLLSILCSLLVYFYYQHCQGLAENDHQECVKILAQIGAMGTISKISSEERVM